MRRRAAALCALALAQLACRSEPVLADARSAPAAAPADAPRASASGQGKKASLPDPADLDAVLGAHLRGGRVDYRALARDAEARRRLQRFLAAVARMPRQAPLAVWLNAYNALVIAQVLEHYPIASVMDVPGFFKTLKHPVAGTEMTLDEIEHSVIRARFADARVHMALNCGAVSCPDLRARAFREATLDADLERLARRAVADPRHVRREGDKLYLSAIFFWFKQDFVRDAGSVVAWIARYRGPKSSSLPADIELVQLPYDWRLADSK